MRSPIRQKNDILKARLSQKIGQNKPFTECTVTASDTVHSSGASKSERARFAGIPFAAASSAGLLRDPALNAVKPADEPVNFYILRHNKIPYIFNILQDTLI